MKQPIHINMQPGFKQPLGDTASRQSDPIVVIQTQKIAESTPAADSNEKSAGAPFNSKNLHPTSAAQ